MRANSDLEKGSSMVEVIALLGILAVISVAMFSGIKVVQGRIKITNSHQQITRIVKAMRTQFSSYMPTLTAANSAKKLYDAGVLINSDVIKNAGSYRAVNNYGDNMIITTTQDLNGNNIFELRYENMPLRVCTELVLSDWGADPSSGLKSIEVLRPGSTKFEWERLEPTAAKFLPPTMGDALAACNGPSNTIIWQFFL